MSRTQSMQATNGAVGAQRRVATSDLVRATTEALREEIARKKEGTTS